MIVIAFGANLTSVTGPPATTIAAALRTLQGDGVEVVAVSPFYESEAWPDPRDPTYVNAVAVLATSMSPEHLLERLLAVEKQFGRVRSSLNAPRTLDIDLLDYNGIVRGLPPILPHPRLHARIFVLVPLADVAPAWRHPVSGASVNDLIAALPPREQTPLRKVGRETHLDLGRTKR